MFEWIKTYASVIIIVCSVSVAIFITHYIDSVSRLNLQAQFDKYKLEQAQAIASATLTNQDTLQLLAKERQNAETKLAVIVNHPISRVQLPSSCTSQASTTAASVPTVPASGVLPESANSILDADRQRTWEIVSDAEEELADCRIVKAWAARQ